MTDRGRYQLVQMTTNKGSWIPMRVGNTIVFNIDVQVVRASAIVNACPQVQTAGLPRQPPLMRLKSLKTLGWSARIYVKSTQGNIM